MELTKLRLFCSLATTLHFGRAAELNHVSPSTLSRNIQQLEEEVGLTLFERDSRSVALTQDGQHFLEFARDLIHQWESFQASVARQPDHLKGSISIYCSVTASYSFLYDLLTEFRERYPLINIKLHTGDPAQALSRLMAGHEDFVIAARPDNLANNTCFKPISNSPLVFITDTKSNEWEAKAWENIPIIIPETGISRERLERWFKAESIKPKIYAEVQGNEAIVSMVSLGFGVGVVPQVVVDNSPLATKVKRFHPQPNLGPYNTGIFVLDKRLKNPVVNAFWNSLQ
jgi:LysR family positive regulator for ilvC